MHAPLLIGLMLAATSSLPHTRQESWTVEGWLEFRFGMGPGDVADVLASRASRVHSTPGALAHTPLGETSRLIASTTDLSVGGQTVRLMFLFFRDRLYSFFADAAGTEASPGFDDTAAGVAWRRGLEAMLAEAYGAPSANDNGQPIWVQGSAFIRLLSQPRTYASFEHSTLAAHVQRERERGEEQRRRFVTDEASMPRTAPGTWSKHGWRALRWGMGLGDVVARVSRASPDIDRFGTKQEGETFFLSTLRDEVYGTTVNATFFFRSGALSRLELSPEASGARLACQQEREWFERARRALQKEHGAARCVEIVDGGGTECEWRRPPLALARATLFRFAHEGCAAEVDFEDASTTAPLARATETRVHTPSSSWKKNGWTEFKWGMGVGDVEQLLRMKQGLFKATAPLKCLQSQDTRGGMDCDLEEGSHAFAIVGVRPSFVFAFLDAKLHLVQLNFATAGDEGGKEKFWRLKALLIEKYGKPSMNAPPTSGETVDLLGLASWDATGLDVMLHGGIKGGRMTASVVYRDPEVEKEIRKRRADPIDDREKL